MVNVKRITQLVSRKAERKMNMAFYVKRTTKLKGFEPFTVCVNDYSTREIAEKACKLLEKLNPLSAETEWQKFFITENY